MSEQLNTKVLNDFWEQHATHNPGRTIEDFEVRWREGYAFYYDIIDKTDGRRALSLHADVVDYSTDPLKIAEEINKATKQILSGDAERVADVDHPYGHPPKSNVKPRPVQEWLDAHLDEDEDL